MEQQNLSKPSRIFKYTSFEIGESIISNKCLKFTNPKSFNDPFDCNFDSVYFDVSEKLDSRVENDIEVLRKGFPNDVLTNDLLSQAYEKTQKNKKDGCAVCCFSLNQNNNLMWAHYANNHKGICLEFDYTLSLEEVIDVRIDIQGCINYDLDEKVNYCTDKIRGMRNIFLNKSSSWRYEEEFRLLILDEEGIYHYKPKFLKSVVFGLRTTEHDRNRLMRACERLQLTHLNFYVAEASKGVLHYKRLYV
jgi:hypothetical protein